MRKLLTALLVILISLALSCGKKGGDKLGAAFPDSIVDDAVIATVNDYPIKGKELRLFSTMFMPRNHPGIPDSTFNIAVLDRYIDRILIWREAVDSSTTVDDSTSNAIIERFISSMGGQQAVDDFLARTRLDRDLLMKSLKEDLVINRFIQDRFSSMVQVDEEGAKAYFDQNRDQFITPDSVRARHILVLVKPTDSPELKKVKREAIERLLARARAGEDFAKLAMEHSDDPVSKVRGGDLGFFPRKAMVAPFDSAAFSLKVGEVSGVVETSYGYHIIKVEARRPGKELAFDDVKNDIMAKMWETQMAGLIQKHLQEIRDVAIIKRNY